MKRSRLLNLFAAALVGLTTGTPTLSVADDTEIYLGSASAQEGIRPNVLFILDTSGSMSGNIDANGDRLDHMKDAFNQIMDSVNNINVGLMRFTDPGGPILFPVSYIDEDVNNIEGPGAGVGFPINVRVVDGADDAEEIISTGTVDIASVDLNIIDTSTGATQTITVANDPGMRVISQTNNAEEDGDDDIITLSQIDMNSIQTNAVRFDSVPIPADSPLGSVTIDDARIIFTARNGDSDAPTFEIHGESNLTPATFPTACTDCADVTSRARTVNSVIWQPPPWSTDEKGPDTTTEDVSTIVQELIQFPGWPAAPALGAGNPMVFIIDPTTTGGQRRAYTFDGSGGDPDKRAELQVTYTETGGGAAEEQIVGMRFQDVTIPQGATITSAVLEFFPSETRTDDIDVDIVGENVDDSAAFTTATSDLSGRAATAAVVNWKETDDWDDLNVAHQTADLTPIIQEIVSRTGWCGNNSLSLLIQEAAATPANGPLNAFSFDGDQSRAPILRVDFDEATVPPGACVNTIVTSQIFASSDDAEETISNGNISLGGSQFDMQSSQINGLRFTNIPITQGATITEATLTFTVRNVDTSASTLRFRTEALDDAPTFVGSNSNISDRTPGISSVDWAAPSFATVGEVHTTVDIAPIIRDVINRSGWQTFNSLVIIQSHVSGSPRRARTFNHDPIDAPVLTIKTEGVEATAPITVREKLKEIVDNLDHAGFTPIVGTMYEAAKYYRGEDVVWGAQRGFDNGSGDPTCSDPPHRCNGIASNITVRQNTRVSHPGSWTGGTIVKPVGCTDQDLNATECEGEIVTGNPVYETPVEESCQANYIVLLTDGGANHNDTVPRINTDFGLTCTGGTTADETCGEELADFLFTEDQLPGMSGDQNVITYTIGFNFSGAFLGDVATAGGGEFFTADTGAELADVFQTIIADILSRSTSFATPSLSVNAFNRLFDLNDVYFSLFIPDTRVAWRGNIKRYQLCDDSTVCDLGEVLDANDVEAISEADQRIKDDALSFWSSAPDGAEIEIGGAAENVPPAASRQVFFFHDLADPLNNPINESLALNVNEVADDNDDGILDGLVSHPDHPDPLADTRFFLGDDAALLSTQQRADLIDWILGVDVDDEDEDTDVTENRFTLSDPLHSSPIAITFGGDAADPVIKLFVGSNDGGLTMINAFNGIEEWVFYPQDMMRLQGDLKNNSNGEHIYGLDGVPSPWIFDANGDGIIDDNDGDFVRIVIGQRRGGENYYAVDVTPTSVLTDATATGEIDPTLLWRIEGGSTEFPNLGQTWSRPRIATIRVGEIAAGVSSLQDVFVFGGGYDVGQDDGFFGPSSPGNAVYVVDALTGELVFTMSSDDPAVGDRLVVDDMNCPVPSDIATFDSDGDGADDRMYFGDVCGQVWRADIRPNLDAGFTGIKAVVGKFAVLSELDPDPLLVEDHRKIFFSPDVVQVLNTEFSSVARFDMVLVVTGRRDNPLNLDVDDRAYALREFHVDALEDTNEDGEPDAGTYTTILGPTVAETGTLFDATDVVEDPEGSDSTELQDADGWFINLVDDGEKALAAPIVLSGVLFFTTYLPEGVVDASTCSLAEGGGQLYGVNVLTGGVVFNWDDADGTETLTISDKKYTLGAGIPSSAVPIFQEEGVTLLVGGGGGATAINPEFQIEQGKLFWYQQ